jgi:hypothetical protein
MNSKFEEKRAAWFSNCELGGVFVSLQRSLDSGHRVFRSQGLQVMTPLYSHMIERLAKLVDASAF